MLTVLRYLEQPQSISCAELATGRSCLALLAERSDAHHALVPDFAPEGVTHTLDAKTKLGSFAYALNDDLTPSMASLEFMLRKSSRKGGVVLVVVIHYLGYKTDTDEIAELVHDYDAVLVEDCAHALVGDAAGASNADVVLYSYNKFHPVTDGAHICSRRLDIDLSVTQELQPLSVATRQAYLSHLEANRHVANAASAEESERWAKHSDLSYDRYYADISSDLSAHAVSEHSARYIARRDSTLMYAARKVVAGILNEHVPAKLLWRDDAIPFMAFPIRCGGKRAEIARALVAHGVRPGRLSDKWSHGAGCFADDHLLLPLTCSVGDANMMAMVLGDFK